MRVLHIIDSIGMYGAEIMLLHLMESQTELGIEPVVASIGSTDCGEKAIEIEARRRGFRIKPFRMRPGPNWFGAFEILRFARSEGVSLLHSHGYKGNILFGLMPRRLRRLPLMATLHGWTWAGGWTRMRLYVWLDGLSLKFIDRVILVNEAMKDYPRLKRLKVGQVAVVPNGIPNLGAEVQNTDLVSKLYRKSKDVFSIVAVGRLSSEKGFMYLIDAIAKLAQSGLNVQLTILGNGSLREQLETQTRDLRIDDRVHFAGYVENAGMYLKSFDLFCMPSVTEGLPMVLLEAMAAGIPIVASSVGGIPAALDGGRAGLLVTPKDVDMLGASIADIMSNRVPALERAEVATARVRDIYSSQAMGKRYLEIYQELISRQSREQSGTQSKKRCV